MAATESRGIEIGNANILSKIKAERIVAFYPRRTTHTVKTIDDKEVRRGFCCLVDTQNLRRHTLSACIDGCDLEIVLSTRADGERKGRFPLSKSSVVERSVTNRRVDDIIRRNSRRFEFVCSRLPRELYGVVLLGEQGGKLMNGERLDNAVFDAVFVIDKAEQGLIDAARQLELKRWVVAKFHVGEVLVRHDF